jgi:hypothetical protein
MQESPTRQVEPAALDAQSSRCQSGMVFPRGSDHLGEATKELLFIQRLQQIGIRARKRTTQPGKIRRSLCQHDQSRNSVAQSPRECQIRKARANYKDGGIYIFVDSQIECTPFVRSELKGIAGRLQQSRDLGSKRRPLRYN